MKQFSLLLAVALLVAGACSQNEDPTQVKLDDIIRIEFTGPQSIPADGVSTTSVKAMIPKEATNRTIKFTTTHGSFPNTGGKTEVSMTVDNNGEASATIIAGREVVTAAVTASTSTFAATMNLSQERAYPHAMTLETNSLSVTRSGSKTAIITAILTRQSGFVSNGTRVTFEAFNGTGGLRGAAVGRFIAVGSSDASGRVSGTFSAEGIPEGVTHIIVVVTVPSASGTTLSSELVLSVSS